MKQLPPRRTTLRPMSVAGVMSGTSADGIDVALVRITPRISGLKLKLLSHSSLPFSRALRSAVLGAMDARSISTADLARLNWRLGMAYLEAVQAALERHPARLELVGCHGQTVYHQGMPALFAGKQVACTWQIGEMALLAAELRVPIVSNFRPADMVAGGQGAPLVSLLDFTLFRDPLRGRVLQNLGGIGNLTAIPAGGSLAEVLAFDTGPANMLIDALMQKLFHRVYDSNGAVASRGRVLDVVISSALRESFFRRKPPKSAGREEFGINYADNFLRDCRAISKRPEDAVATATALTAESIRLAYERFVRPLLGGAPVDYLVSGGGAQNRFLMAALDCLLKPLGCSVKKTDDAGLPAQAKEAAAFALLAYESWHRRPGNVPSATGARRPAILGSITYV